MTRALPELEAWFVTGSQRLYGDDVLRRVDEHAARIAACLDETPAVPVRIVAKPVVTSPDGIAAGPAGGRRGSGLHRRDRLDAHVLAGQDVDRRAPRPAQAPPPPAHAVPPRPAVGRDRHGLHEPAPGRPRGPGVRLHPDPPAPGPQDGRRALAGPDRGGPARRLGARRRRLARGAPAPHRPVRGQHARGRGDRRRQGRGPGATRVLGQRLRRERPRRPGGRGRRTPTSTRSSQQYEELYDVAPALRSAGDRHAELRTAARIEAGLRAFLEEGGFGAFTDTFEDLGRPRAAARDRRPATHGRWLRLRRRGRLEGGRPGPDPQGDGRRPAGRDVVHGGLHLPPRRSGARGPRRPHARGLPIDHAGTDRRARSTRSRSAGGPIRSGSSSTPRRARRASSGSPTSATGSGCSSTRSTWWRPTSRCRSCPWRAPSGARSRT